MRDTEQSENTENLAEESSLPPEPIPGDAGESAESTEEFVPKGAMVFGLILILGYIIYYFLIWHEIVILRGGA